jgi:hypothetical protein
MSVRGTHVTEYPRLPTAGMKPPTEKQRQSPFPVGNFRFFRPVYVRRTVPDPLAIQGRSGRILPEQALIMQIAANKNWEQISVEVPRQLRELEEPARRKRLKKEEYSMPLNRGVGA